MLTGRVISHYRLLEPLGEEHGRPVYRARDLTLEREVAVKLLDGRAASADARDRFRREARIASLVNHPHICAIHDSGEEDGLLFVVTELLEGQTLAEALGPEPLSTERFVDLAVQIADAVAAVHARGLLHGSITPSSIFLTSGGHVKLLDVGLMSAWWEAAQAPSAVDASSPTMSLERRAPADLARAGFHPYQSPEQVLGDRLDQRSDVFSIGAVLYHLATGSVPFSGETGSEIAGAIVSGRRVPAGERSRVPANVLAIVEQALARRPDGRQQTAAELLRVLRRAGRQLEGTEASDAAVVAGRGRLPSRRSLVAAAAVALIVAAVALTMAPGRRAPWFGGRPERRHTVLVGSIANGTNDPDFDGTLREALLVHLGQSPYLDIVPDERLRQILQMMGRSADAPLPHDVAWEACQRLGGGAMLEGSVSAVGPATSVALVATDCSTGETIRREQVDVDRKEGVLRAVGSLASSMRTSLGESAASLERHNVSIEEATTPSLDALRAYTAGAALRAEGRETEAIPLFERAIALDPGFALAYTTLSSLYGGLGETGRSEEYARLAYEHRRQVTERERLFIAYQYHDRVTGEQNRAREALEVWKQSYPRDYRPANALAVLLNRLGDYDQAIAEAEEAIRRNPGHSFPYSNLAYAYRGAGRYEEARRAGERAVALGIETLPTRRLLYQLAEMAGDAAAARAHFEWAQERARAFDLTGARAQVLAFRGRMREARALYREAIDQATASGFAQVSTGYAAQAALTEALFGYHDQALAQAREVPRETTYAPRLRAATALALAGRPAEAERIARQFRDWRPEDTLLQRAYLPVTEAAILLARGRPAPALEVLRPASALERGTVAALMPVYFRGLARLQERAFAEAAADFRLLLRHRGADPFSAAVPAAQLGLARALTGVSDASGGAAAYDALLQIWAAADPDLPLLQQARGERASLP